MKEQRRKGNICGKDKKIKNETCLEGKVNDSGALKTFKNLNNYRHEQGSSTLSKYSPGFFSYIIFQQ